ncbi:ChaN family lipoprotein [Asticcacaulis biprosthecium]|uniref:ChaN family lipoprotein n=1 Tax=Asticcacaulis biprosthecium TaxID=76891 RepID=UPI0006813D71|nr:ChaN family lipoprotein [Asticcacaulis biprosthecium]
MAVTCLRWVCAAAMMLGASPGLAGAGSPASVKPVGEGFQLDAPLVDFYDTAFVMADPAGGAPRVLSPEALADLLSGYDIVVFGESHRHSGVHLQQQLLFRALVARDPNYILSLEQFERDVQPVVNDYLAGRVGEMALTSQGRAWDNYATSYRPLVEFARVRQIPVVAAEAPVWAVVCIGQWGTGILDRFTAEERAWVARDLNPATGAYGDKYMAFQSSAVAHGGGAATSPEALLKAERSLAGQVARDDTMAESIILARQAHPGRKVLHLNGNFHSAGFLGTVERLKLRDPGLKIAVIDPLEVDNPLTPTVTAGDLANGTVVQLIYPNPPGFVDGEDTSTWVAGLMSKRKANTCKYSPEVAG